MTTASGVPGGEAASAHVRLTVKVAVSVVSRASGSVASTVTAGATNRHLRSPL